MGLAVASKNQAFDLSEVCVCVLHTVRTSRLELVI